LLGSKGLGRTANGSIAFLGVLATVFVYSRLWGAPVADDLPALIGVSVAMSTLAIIAAAFVKMFIVNEATSFSLGNKTSFGTKSGRSSAKGPSADRMNMAMKR
jgi:hypothetical protein